MLIAISGEVNSILEGQKRLSDLNPKPQGHFERDQTLRPAKSRPEEYGSELDRLDAHGKMGVDQNLQ